MKDLLEKLFMVVVLLVPAILSTPCISHSQSIRLVIRGDDMGMTEGSLEAFTKAFNDGILTSGAIIVPAPWFEGAAELCKKNPQWCTGVHLALVGEWIGYRWRPVLPWDKVPSLVDKDGFLYTHPDSLFSRKPSLKEIEAEFRAQIELAKKKGINVQYLDTHYQGYNSYPGLEEIFLKIAKDYNQPLSRKMGETNMRSVYSTPVPEKKEEALKQLDALKPGLWLWVCHIGIESPEQNALFHASPKDRFTNPGVGAHRAAELAVLLDPDVKAMIRKKGIILTSYTDLAKEKR
ncbi:MAG: ChbG/HpnK family deacetylase [Candidatus Latescibacterota bacterium]